MSRYLSRLFFCWTCFFSTSQLFSLEGASSYPYLSGYTWGFFSDWRLLNEDYGSPPEDFPPESVQLGDTVFVDFTRIGEFLTDYLPKIEKKVIVITGNYGYAADNPMPGPFAALLEEEKVALWLVQNIDREATEKLIPIPIGLANKHWVHGNTELLDEWIPHSLTKSERGNLIYLNFTLWPGHYERQAALDYFKEMGGVHAEGKSYEEYLSDLSESVFVVSPPGNGNDCHRTWEALLMGCYPIVKSSTLNPLYEGLPIVVVNDWSEATIDFLLEKKREFDSLSYSREKLYAPFWFDLVKRFQQDLRNLESSEDKE